MGIKLQLLLSIVILCFELSAQDVFVKYYGQFSGKGSCVIIETDGNYLFAGSKHYGQSGRQFCIYKTDPNGNTIWIKHYGGAKFDEANEIIPTIDGGYALIGQTETTSSISTSCVTFIKVDNSGDSSWTKTYGDVGSNNGASIVQTSSGNYFIGGSTNYNTNGKLDFLLIKTKPNGDTIWTKKYGGAENEEITSIASSSDGGVVMTGYTESFGKGFKDYYLVKVDSNGSVQWSKTYGDSLFDIANSVKSTNDGGYIIAGTTNFSGISGDIFVVKTDVHGDTIWTKVFAIIGKPTKAYDIIITNDGGFAIAGLLDYVAFQPPSSYSNGGSDVFLLKLNSTGIIQNQKQFSIERTTWCCISSHGTSIAQNSDGSCVIGGTFFDGSTNQMLLIRTFDIGPVGVLKDELSSMKIYPNPASDQIIIKFDRPIENYSITLFDFYGAQVESEIIFVNDHIKIQRGNLRNGIYLCQLINKTGNRIIGKIVFE